MMADDERLLTPYDLAERLGIKVRTAREWCRTGKLPAVRMGDRGLLRVKESDLAAYVSGLPRAGK